mmetsp:Transcript_4334/g.8775  ORF Transcript_4334/g.8775 Transcript_4334/m.8775 type:complete len:108 (-) Transcript_4334:145-468(-)
MSSRRLNRVLLGVPYILKAAQVVRIRWTPSNELLRQFNTYFLPGLRYHNAKVEFQVTRSDHQGGEEDQFEVLFGDLGSHELNLQLYECPHQLMQRLRDIDIERSLMR